MSTYFPVVVFHNPECGTSRKVLEMVGEAGFVPTIIDYRKEGWTRPQLLALFAAAGITARQALRDKTAPAAELGLLEPGVPEEVIIEAMLAHPVLVNRPLVATPLGVRLCRPAELVKEVLQKG